MPANALVIGLGGTGSLVARDLKRILSGDEGGEVPPGIQLLVVDTLSADGHPAAGMADADIAQDLAPKEYCYVGGNLNNTIPGAVNRAKEVSADQGLQLDQRKLRHWSDWFLADVYLKLVPAALNANNGASQFRQIGRAVLFEDVQAPQLSRFVDRLKSKIENIKNSLPPGIPNPTIDIIVVASVAGGTGCGLFIDVAHLARQLALLEYGLNAKVWGFFVLPEAFKGIPGGANAAMRARAYAAIRENRRFAATAKIDYVRGYPVLYHDLHATPNPHIWCSNVTNRLFEFLFYLDGQRANNSVADHKPEFGIAPSVADAIAAILDGQALYDQHLTNLLIILGNNVNVADVTADSTIGTYSVVQPMNHIVDFLAYRLALDSAAILSLSYAPLPNFSFPTNLPTHLFDADGYPHDLPPDQNREAGIGVAGQTRVSPFLGGGALFSFDGQDNIGPTGLLPDFWTIVDRNTDADAIAQRAVSGWDKSFEPIGEDISAKAARDAWGAEKDSVVCPKLPNTKTAVAGEVESYYNPHFGGENKDGSYNGGSCQRALDLYKSWQLERFRARLGVEVRNTLNGNPGNSASDSLARKGGKLGYLHDFLSGLSGVLAKVVAKLNDAQQSPSRQIKTGAINKRVTETRNDMERPGGLLARFPGQPAARRTAYRDAQRDRVAHLRDVLIEQKVAETAREMLVEVNRLQAQVKVWGDTLITEKGTSLFGQWRTQQGEIASAVAKEQAQVPVREIIWDPSYIQSLYQQYGAKALIELLNQVNWDLTFDGDGKPELKLRWNTDTFTPTDQTIDPQAVTSVSPDDQRLVLSTRFISVGEAAFAPIWQAESVLKYLTTHAQLGSRWNPQALGKRMAENGEPMLDGYRQQTHVIPAAYLHVDETGLGPLQVAATQYVQDLKQAFTPVVTPRIQQDIASQDRYKLRLVSLANLITIDQTTSYAASRQPYWATPTTYTAAGATIVPRETYHVFPAEINAVSFEAQLHTVPGASHGAQPLELSPEVVVELEDLWRFRNFVDAWVYGVIQVKLQRPGNMSYYALVLPPLGGLGPMQIAGTEIELTPPRLAQASLSDALHYYNYDHRDRLRQDIVEPQVVQATEAEKQRRVESLTELVLAIDATTSTILGTKTASVQADIKRLYGEYRLLEQAQARVIESVLIPSRKANNKRDVDVGGLIWLQIESEKQAVHRHINYLLG